MLRTRLTLPPGRPGTKTLLAEYGDRLVCVRYRYDDELLRRYKTVEVIVEEAPWTPTRPFTATDLVDVRLHANEHRLRRAAALLGAHPAPTPHLWLTTYAVATILHLTPRARRPHPPVDGHIPS